MNKIVLALVLALALAPRAYAHPVTLVAGSPPAEEDPRNLFGFRISLGMLPIDHMHLATVSIGLGVEHPVFGQWRVFGDYEWLWLMKSHTATMDGIHGDGQRISLGVRHTLASKQLMRELRLYVDGELGGSFALVDESMDGVHTLPAALAGVRVGYDLAAHRTSESSLLQFELLVRAIAAPGGAGVTGGVGALWK